MRIDYEVDECQGCGAGIVLDSARECLACSNIICDECGMYGLNGEINTCNECNTWEE